MINLYILALTGNEKNCDTLCVYSYVLHRSTKSHYVLKKYDYFWYVLHRSTKCTLYPNKILVCPTYINEIKVYVFIRMSYIDQQKYIIS